MCICITLTCWAILFYVLSIKCDTILDFPLFSLANLKQKKHICKNYLRDKNRCLPIWHPYKTKLYHFCDKPAKSWYDSYQVCKDYGTQILMPSNEEENSFIASNKLVMTVCIYGALCKFHFRIWNTMAWNVLWREGVSVYLGR